MKSQSVTIELKANNQDLLWYCLLRCTRWFYLSNLWMKSYSVTIELKANEQDLLMVLFIMLYKVVQEQEKCPLNGGVTK